MRQDCRRLAVFAPSRDRRPERRYRLRDGDGVRKQAESCNQYLKKGRQVGVQGRLSHSEWVKDEQRHERREVVAAAVTFLGQRPTEQAQPEAAPTEEEVVPAAA